MSNHNESNQGSRIDAIRKRRAALFANGWHVFDRKSNPPGVSRVMERGSNFLVAEVGNHTDAEFIAAAPADLDYLLSSLGVTQTALETALAEVERLRAELAKRDRPAQIAKQVREVIEATPKEQLVQEMVAISEELGLYEETGNPPVKEPASFMEELRALDQALVTTDDEQEDG